MQVHSTHTDNSYVQSKINLRRLATKNLKEIKVLDLFAGENKLWSSFKLAKYYGVEKVKGKGKNLNADNIRVIESLDLSRFNVIDVDSYGIPANQIYKIYQNQSLQKGTVIIYTCITNKMSGLNKEIINMFNLGDIYKKCKVILNGYAIDMFYGMLYSLRIYKIVEYNIKDKFDKHYGYFIV